jgi:TPR repeat protein
LLPCTACGSGAAAKAVQPDAPTAKQAVDSSKAACQHPSDADQPLVVDMPPEQRTDLEIAMRTKIAIVSYDCKSMKIFRDCHVDGDYSFFGTTLQEKTVRLKSADEISVNLPLAGAGLIAKLGGQLKGGSTLDLAMMMVGARRSTWNNVRRSDLKGTCDGATHYVAGAFIGAFAMQQGSEGSAATTASVFGAGGSASSDSSKSVGSKVGNPDACTKADPMAKVPPDKCGVPIRLELFPILANDAKAADHDTDSPASLASDVCPEGYALTHGKCAVSSAVIAHRCAPKEGADCVKQCGLGDGPSCGYAAVGYRDGKAALTKDPAQAFAYAKKGCDLKDTDSCDTQGGLMRTGQGTTKDVEAGVSLQTTACRSGSARGCRDVGTYFASAKPQDWKMALAYAERACDGGNTAGCSDAGDIYRDGRGIDKDLVKAVAIYKRGCEGFKAGSGWDQNCVSYARALEHGDGVAKDCAAAATYYTRSCHVAGNAYACADRGALAQTGCPGYPADPTVALKSFQSACSAGMQAPCTQVAVALIGGKGVPADRAKGVGLLKNACKKKHQPACDELKKMGEKED